MPKKHLTNLNDFLGFQLLLPSVAEFHRINRLSTARGLYHRWGISPRPENYIDLIIILVVNLSIKIWEITKFEFVFYINICYNEYN